MGASPSGAQPHLAPALAFRDLRAEGGGRIALTGVSGVVPGGVLCAVMGPSGSGKSSFIKAMCGVRTGLHVSGDISVVFGDGQKKMPLAMGYVAQDEALAPLLTVRETLRFAAALRGLGDPRVAAEAMLRDTGLQRVASSLVGDEASRGISGGEYRRLRLALALLSRPPVLCADEPTTGLDASSAKAIVDLLQSQVAQGRTVLCSIHQPRQEIFETFGFLLLFAGGHLLYSGPIGAAVLGMERAIGHECPEHQNPADFLIDASCCSQDLAELARKLSSSCSEGARSAAAELDQLIIAGTSLRAARSTKKTLSSLGCCLEACSCGAHVFREVWILTWRGILTTYRDKRLLVALVLQSIVLGLGIGCMNLGLSTRTLGEIRALVAVIAITMAHCGTSVMMVDLYLLCEKMPLLDAERGRDRLYTACALVCSHLFAGLPANIIASLPLAWLVYSLVGLRQGGIKEPLTFLVAIILVRVQASAFAMLCASMVKSRSYAKAMLIPGVYNLVNAITAGLYFPIASLPAGVAWLRWVNYQHYAFRWIASVQLSGRDLELGCSGDLVLQRLGFQADDEVFPPVALLVLIAAWCSFSVAALACLPATREPDIKLVERKATGAGVGDVSHPDPHVVARDVEGALPTHVTGASVSLEEVTLDISIRSSQGHLLTRILHVTSASFASGQVSVVIGPSGAGKTSLLSVISGRAADDRSCRFAGSVRLDGRPTAAFELRHCVSMVTQTDHHLAGLTVQETLSFAARLRLPRQSAKAHSERIAWVQQAFQLEACFNTRVGSTAAGGISGGERRRLSVAVACLGEPVVLVLDEPTSGLDASSALVLSEALAHLALTRGTAVVCSLHQPRPELVAHCGGLMLLGLGGSVLFSGPPGNLADHLRACGLHPPRRGNILDFALDACSDTAATAVMKHRSSLLQRSGEAAFEQVGERPRYIEPCPMSSALRILLHRSALNLQRHPALIWTRCLQGMISAVLTSLIVGHLGRTQDDVIRRIGVLQNTVNFGLMTGVVNNIATFPIDRDLFLREHADGLYSALPFFVVYMVSEFATASLSSSLAGLWIVFGTGLRHDSSALFTCVVVMFCCLFTGETVGIVFNSTVRHAGFSLNLVIALYQMISLVGGLLFVAMPPWVKMVCAYSPVTFAARALAISQFTPDERFECARFAPHCLRTGSDVLDMLGLGDVGSLEGNVGRLVLLSIAYRIAAFVVLKIFLEPRRKQAS